MAADVEVAIPEQPALLAARVSSASARVRDLTHGGALTDTEHRTLEADAERLRGRPRFRALRRWNETGIVLVPHAAGLAAYHSDVAETRALSRVLAARDPDAPRPTTCAVGPVSGVLVSIRTVDGSTVLTRRSDRCRSWGGHWGVSAGETLGPGDVVHGALSPTRASLRAIREELNIGEPDVIEIESVGIVRDGGRSAHHLVTIAHVSITADELMRRAWRARDAWEWDRLDVVPVDAMHILDDVAAGLPVIPVAVGALTFCFEPDRLSPVGV